MAIWKIILCLTLLFALAHGQISSGGLSTQTFSNDQYSQNAAFGVINSIENALGKNLNRSQFRPISYRYQNQTNPPGTNFFIKVQIQPAGEYTQYVHIRVFATSSGQTVRYALNGMELQRNQYDLISYIFVKSC